MVAIETDTPGGRRLKITVLGKSPSWQDAGGACSGYLIDAEAATVLLDCGSGVFGKLRAMRDHREVDAIVISHMHGDHILDLIPFAYALQFGPSRVGPDSEPAPIRLLLPPGGRQVMGAICGTWGGEDLIEKSFEVSEYQPGASFEVGGIVFTTAEVPHFIPAYAVSAQAHGSGRFVFGADCGPADAIIDFARGADLLMLEATLAEDDPAAAVSDPQAGHLSGSQAGDVAGKAGARRLVLTHLSDCNDVEASREGARAAFGGPVEIAAEGVVWEV